MDDWLSSMLSGIVSQSSSVPPLLVFVRFVLVISRFAGRTVLVTCTYLFVELDFSSVNPLSLRSNGLTFTGRFITLLSESESFGTEKPSDDSYDSDLFRDLFDLL